ALLKDGFAGQRERLIARLNEARARKESLEASYDLDLRAAENATRKEIVRLRHRAAAARVAALESALAAVDLTERKTQQGLERAKLKREALRPYVAVLRGRMNHLLRQKSRGRIERLQQQIDASAESSVERAFLAMQLLKETSVEHLQKDYGDAVRDRFHLSSLEALTASVERDRDYWQNFSASLKRRSGLDVRRAYATAGRECDAIRAQRSRLQSLLDVTISEQREVQELEAQTMVELDGLE